MCINIPAIDQRPSIVSTASSLLSLNLSITNYLWSELIGQLTLFLNNVSSLDDNQTPYYNLLHSTVI